MSKHRYEVIIYWSEDDNAFIAEVPELAGCIADGASYEEALQNVHVIIDEWIADDVKKFNLIEIYKDEKIELNTVTGIFKKG